VRPRARGDRRAQPTRRSASVAGASATTAHACPVSRRAAGRCASCIPRRTGATDPGARPRAVARAPGARAPDPAPRSVAASLVTAHPAGAGRRTAASHHNRRRLRLSRVGGHGPGGMGANRRTGRGRRADRARAVRGQSRDAARKHGCRPVWATRPAGTPHRSGSSSRAGVPRCDRGGFRPIRRASRCARERPRTRRRCVTNETSSALPAEAVARGRLHPARSWSAAGVRARGDLQARREARGRPPHCGGRGCAPRAKTPRFVAHRRELANYGVFE
jgi:hypothetical protein